MRDWQLSSPSPASPLPWLLWQQRGMSKWKGWMEYGFLCKSKEPDSQNHLEQSEQGQGSLPAAGTACSHGTRGKELSGWWQCTEPGQISTCWAREEDWRVMLLFTSSVKQLFPPALVWRIMGHYALSAIKGLLTSHHHAGPGMELREPRIQLRKSQQQLLRWCLQGTDLGTMQDGDCPCFVSSTEAKGWQTPTCSCLAAPQGCSPRVWIHQGANTVCPNPTLSHRMPSFPHWHRVPFTRHTDAWPYHCWAQPGVSWLLRVCDIQIINSFEQTLYFCCPVWSIPILVQS